MQFDCISYCFLPTDFGLYEPRHKKTGFCTCEKKAADQRPCFRYTDSTIPLLSKSEISSH